MLTNATPHDIHVHMADGSIVTLPRTERCRHCGDIRATVGLRLGLSDQDTDGGLGRCGDAHEWTACVARASEERETVGHVDRIPVQRVIYGALRGIPAPSAGIFYIVSALAAQADPERTDLLVVSDPVRDEEGRVVGCRALAMLSGAKPLRQEFGSSPADIRARGWDVAVHNDYHLQGSRFTFWLFTNGSRCAKGEGPNDAYALDIVREKIALLEESP